DPEKCNRPPNAADFNRAGGNVLWIHPTGIPNHPPRGDRERTEPRRWPARVPERGSGVRHTRGGPRGASGRRPEAQTDPRVEAVQRPFPQAALPPDPGPRDGRGDWAEDDGAPPHGCPDREV